MSRRLFADAVDAPRFRQGTDLVLLVGSVAAAVALEFAADPPSTLERSIIEMFASIPGGIGDVLALVLVPLLAWAAVLLVAAAAQGRWSAVRDAVVAGTAATGVALVLARLAGGTWIGIAEAWSLDRVAPWVPPLPVVVTAAVVTVLAPHLTVPARVVGRWLVGGATLAVTMTGDAAPSAALAAVCAGAAGAACVHLAFGSARGRPALDDIAEALAALGLDARPVGIVDRQPAGAFLVAAETPTGVRLLVKVRGRDAHDTQVLTTLWRAVWYRQPAARVALGRLRQTEHEALVTMLAARAGVPVPDVVAVGETARRDAVLVLDRPGVALDDDPERWTDERARAACATLDLLHEYRIAHGEVDGRTLVAVGSDAGLVDFGGGAVGPPEYRYQFDDAQCFAALVIGLGVERAVSVTAGARPVDAIEELLPFVQPGVLTAHQREQMRAGAVDLDAARDALAAAAGVEAPELERVRRITVRSIVQTALLLVAFFALTAALGDLDFGRLGDQLADATWALVVLGFAVAQSPRFTQTISTLGASPVPLPFGPVYALQLSISYLGLAAPSSAARVAVNVRFFQRQGMRPGSALTLGALDSVVGIVVQALLLLVIVLTAGSLGLGLELDSPVPGNLDWIVGFVAVVAAVGGIAAVAFPDRRAVVTRWFRELLGDARRTLRGGWTPRRVGQLALGNLGTELLFTAALACFAAGLGHPVGFVELLLINTSVSLLAGLLPVPGGIGVVEGGLALGLVRAGVPEEAAFAIVILHRLATFYLPPIWGYLSFRWLERNGHL